MITIATNQVSIDFFRSDLVLLWGHSNANRITSYLPVPGLLKVTQEGN